MSKLVTIFGGSGFVGRYIARRMAKQGWRVRVAVRRPNEAIFTRTYGAVGQVEPVLCNIRNAQSVAMAVAGADAVVNCVGVLTNQGKNKFDAVHAAAVDTIAQACADAGVGRVVHISAIGADPEAASEYAQTKAKGEAALMAHVPTAVILRPSVVFGPEDQFFNRFANMTRFPGVVPVVGAQTKFQPVYVDDVAAAVERAIIDPSVQGIYELGGPDVASFAELMTKMADVVQRRPAIVPLPFFIGGLMATGFSVAQFLTAGLFHNNMLTKDQLLNLRNDNVVSSGARGLADLGVSATSMDVILPQYLWCYRPSGQYADIKNSARDLNI